MIGAFVAVFCNCHHLLYELTTPINIDNNQTFNQGLFALDLIKNEDLILFKTMNLSN